QPVALNDHERVGHDQQAINPTLRKGRESGVEFASVATRDTSSTPSGTPKWRPTDSRIFGGTDDGGAGFIAQHGRSSLRRKRRAISYRSLARRRSHLARSALPRADRGVRREHQPALWFGRLERGRRRSF